MSRGNRIANARSLATITSKKMARRINNMAASNGIIDSKYEMIDGTVDTFLFLFERKIFARVAIFRPPPLFRFGNGFIFFPPPFALSTNHTF